ncbi:S1 family peptidase [Pedobacter xixiisoli]|uniref:Trypsin-like peptidase domain-containing protein n=1 Tax=Pedobacter xixiisoli TaxID=1476464 RepID=A0A286ACZ0_9SPHI|nr:serine protease [Pedobacter xixiisoli]SOD19771.1 Trypsin-like peptidase domain-containing protein [Pedobacter xixiisoli]
MTYIPKLFLETHKDLIDEVILFFTAEVNGNFDEIKAISKQRNIQMKRDKLNDAIDFGYFSIDEFLDFAHKRGKIKGGISFDAVELVLKILVEEHVLTPAPTSFEKSFGIRYRANGKFAEYLNKRGLILNLIGGWSQIINRYRLSVVKIEHINKIGDSSIGTGYYYAAGDSKISKYLIITNRHVVENASKINVYLDNDTALPYQEIVEDPKLDLAYIVLKEPLGSLYLDFEPKPDVLSEIITIGYPSIPMTKAAYQVYHKGEVNSFVEDYDGNKFFLISAKTSSGNSGSPIINKHGLVVGIVAQDFFEQKQFFEKGKPSYAAGIPSEEIVKSLNTYIFK